MISEDVQRVELEARKPARGVQAAVPGPPERERGAQVGEGPASDPRSCGAAERKDELIESLKKTINQQREIFAQQREEERQQRRRRCRRRRSTSSRSTRAARAARRGDELRELTEFKEQKTSRRARAGRVRPRRPRGRAQGAWRRWSQLLRGAKSEARLDSAQFGAIRARFCALVPTPLLQQVQADARGDEEDEPGGGGRATGCVDQEDPLREPADGGGAAACRCGRPTSCRRRRSAGGGDEEAAREVALNEQSVKEYAKQGFRQSKEIKELCQGEDLERTLTSGATSASATRNWRRPTAARSPRWNSTARGCASWCGMKTKEVSHMKRLQASVKNHRVAEAQRGRDLPARVDRAGEGRDRAAARLLPRGSRGQLLPSLTGATGRRSCRRAPTSASTSATSRGTTASGCCGCSSRGSTTRSPSRRCRPTRSSPPTWTPPGGRPLDAAAEDDGGQYGGGGGFFPTQPEVA